MFCGESEENGGCSGPGGQAAPSTRGKGRWAGGALRPASIAARWNRHGERWAAGKLPEAHGAQVGLGSAVECLASEGQSVVWAGVQMGAMRARGPHTASELSMRPAGPC